MFRTLFLSDRKAYLGTLLKALVARLSPRGVQVGSEVLECAGLWSPDFVTVCSELTETDTASDYFAAVRLSRQEARDSAVNLLQEAMSYDTAPEKTGAELEELVAVALSEAQIESLVIAKGYTDCVAYMTNEGISVAVSAPEGGLQAEDVAVMVSHTFESTSAQKRAPGFEEVEKFSHCSHNRSRSLTFRSRISCT